MSENLRNFVRGAGMLRSVVNRVPDGAWDSPTSCDGWTARDVAGHITWGLRTVELVSDGQGMAEAKPEAEWAGEDPAATVSAAVDDAIAAVDRPDVLHATIEGFGGMTVDGFLRLMGTDCLTHAWDIADAVGIDHGIDDGSAAAAQAALAPMEAQMRGPGRFADAVETDSPSALDQFIAFTGRTSVRG